MSTTDLVARGVELRKDVEAAIRDAMRDVLDSREDIEMIEWNQTPNSYCDEGYFEEGHVIMHGPVIEERRGGKRYDLDYDSHSGVYSQDDEYGYNDKLEDDEYWCLARDLYNKIDALGATRNMLGEIQIKERK